MSFRVIWSEFAEIQLDKIFQYYKDEAGLGVAQRIIHGIINRPDNLKFNPHIGQIEELLRERSFEYRYILYTHYKIIYSVDEAKRQVKIADVFDTRQYPEKIKRQK